MKRYLRAFLHRLSPRLLGRHPYNTIFSYNWVNVRPMVRTFRQLASVFHGRIADLGAGHNPYYDLIASRATSYVSIDYQSSVSKNDTRPIQRLIGGLEAIPLLAESVDAVMCSQVLSQVEQPIHALGEIERILCHGGYAVISVPHVSALHSEPHDLFRFTPDGLIRLVRLAGLQPQSIHTQGQLFSSFALCFAMNLILRPVAVGEPMKPSPGRQALFAPVIALVNVFAFLLDKVLPFNRTPANFILVSMKV